MNVIGMNVPDQITQRLRLAAERGNASTPGYKTVTGVIEALEQRRPLAGRAGADFDPWWRARYALAEAAVQLVSLDEIRNRRREAA